MKWRGRARCRCLGEDKMLSLRVSVPAFTERLFGDKEEKVRIPRLKWGGGKIGERG